jgi:hypothetical protein
LMPVLPVQFVLSTHPAPPEPKVDEPPFPEIATVNTVVLLDPGEPGTDISPAPAAGEAAPRPGPTPADPMEPIPPGAVHSDPTLVAPPFPPLVPLVLPAAPAPPIVTVCVAPIVAAVART